MDHLGPRLADGDADAFAELYDRCGDRLHHFLVVKLASREAADDVLQEVFVRLARSRESLRDVGELVAFTFKVARNEAARWLAREARRREQWRLAAEELFEEACGSDLAAVERAEFLAAALARLSDEQREVIELKAFAQLTLAEIAQVVGCPPGTAATRYRRGLQRLQAFLAGEHQPLHDLPPDDHQAGPPRDQQDPESP